jgi:hypothetical protein
MSRRQEVCRDFQRAAGSAHGASSHTSCLKISSRSPMPSTLGVGIRHSSREALVRGGGITSRLSPMQIVLKSHSSKYL